MNQDLRAVGAAILLIPLNAKTWLEVLRDTLCPLSLTKESEVAVLGLELQDISRCENAFCEMFLQKPSGVNGLHSSELLDNIGQSEVSV